MTPVEVQPEEVIVRPSKTNKARMAAMLLVLIVLAGGLYLYNRYWNIAIVNGQGISRLEYYKALDKQAGKQALEQMVQEDLIEQEALKKNLKIEQSVVDAQIATIEAQIKAQGQTLDSALLAEGMTKADLEKQIRLQKIAEQLSKSTKEITQKQIDDFLTQNAAQLPKTATKEELQSLAKSEIEKQDSSSAITTWLSGLKTNAKIIYR